MTELAAVVEAETANAMSDYVLLKDMNMVAEAKYDGMVKHVEKLQPSLTVILACNDSTHDLLGCTLGKPG